MNVILIDDEAVAVNALRRRVDWGKYGVEQVFTANSMRQAQAVFQEQRIDIMLCDVEMPQGNGLELFEWVKLYYPAVECIYVTCHPQYAYIRQAMKLGSADYLLKPIDYEELDAILTEVVDRVRKGRIAEPLPAESLLKIEEAEAQKTKNQAVNGAKRYILEHIQENIYIADVARAVYLSDQYLMRLFKKETGVSILEYITGERLELAKNLLVSTDYPVSRVADAVGYGNYSYFAKLFKRSFGLTPVAYRQEYGGKNVQNQQK